MVPIRSISALIAAFHDASRSCPVTAECRSLCKRCRRPQLCSKKTSQVQKFFFANGAGERDFALEGGLPSSAERFIRGVVLLRNPIPARRAGTTLVANGNSDGRESPAASEELETSRSPPQNLGGVGTGSLYILLRYVAFQPTVENRRRG